MNTKRITVDITPGSIVSEDVLRRIQSQSVGKPYKNDRGELMGEIKKVTIKDGRLLAEVALVPGVILG